MASEVSDVQLFNTVVFPSSDKKEKAKMLKKYQLTVYDLCELDQYLESLQYRETKGDTLKVYYTGEFDGNQSQFEQLTTQNMLCVKAYDEFQASVLFRVLRALIDKTNVVLTPPEAEDDNDRMTLEEMGESEEVSETPNELVDGSQTTGDLLATVLGVKSAAKAYDLWKLRSRINELKMEVVRRLKAEKTKGK